MLNQYLEVGVTIDARINKDLIIAIFQPASPLHDGAITIQGERITAAGCFLPLTRQTEISSQFGTRHRAALGISQETDAAVIVVSEEHGIILVGGRRQGDQQYQSRGTRIPLGGSV